MRVYLRNYGKKNHIPKSGLNRVKQPYWAPDINASMCSKANHLLNYLSDDEIKKTNYLTVKRFNCNKKAKAGGAQSFKDNMLFTNILSTQIWMQEFINT